MTNKTITLSRDALKWAIDQLEEDGNRGTGYLDTLRAALADPVPPAGGEPEVLELLAKAATPGPWDVANKRYGGVIRGGPMQTFTNGSAQSQIVMCCGAEWMEPGQLERNAEYIAAANPSAILALLDDHRTHVTRLQAEVFELRTALQVANKNTKQVMAQRDTISVKLFKANDESLEYMTKMKRAQAEVERLKSDNMANALAAGELVKGLQAELTKARECIDHVLGLLRADKSTHAQHAIILYQGVPSNEFNQSAPADKSDDDWRMNPCKQGHRDVGAAGGVAHCYTCDEKIEAATTQEAFELWNSTHPAAQP